MIHVTAHAVERAMERLGIASPAEADAALRSRAIVHAAAFGAPYVRLSGGQRVVLEGSNVVTVLPAECPPWRLGVRK